MSLQVWLPLTGDLHNQGLDGEQRSSTAYSVIDDGKIGRAIKTSTSDYIITSVTSDKWDFTKKDISFGCWVRMNKNALSDIVLNKEYHDNYKQAGGTLLGRDSYGGCAIRWCTNNILDSGSFSTVSIYTHMRNTTSNSVSSSTYVLPFDTWIHCMYVIDRTNSEIRFYINGLLYDSRAFNPSLFMTGNVSQGSFCINKPEWDGGNGMSVCVPIDLNDVRIYDHALSNKEVSEIAKGLCLHYPLRDNIQTLVTSSINPTFNTSSSTGGWSHWGATGANGSFSQNTNSEFIYKHSDNPYSHRVSNDASATGSYLLYQEKLFDGGYRSFQAIIKESNGLPITEDICYPDWNGLTNLSVANGKWTKIIDLGDGFYWCICEGINQTTSPTSANSHLVGIYVKPGYTIYVSAAYVEDGKQMCTPLFYNQLNLITSLKSGGQTTVNGFKVTTSGTNADTYFYLNLSEPLIEGQLYTLSCVGSNIPNGGYWGFPIASQSNTDITMAIYNGVNTYSFIANATSSGKTQIIMDDNYRSNVCDYQCVFDNWTLTKAQPIYDCSGYGHDAYLNGSVSCLNSGGKNFRCTSLDSTTVGVDTLAGASYIKSDFGLTSPSALTVALWLNPVAWSRGGMISTTSSKYPSDYTVSAINHYDGNIRFNDTSGNYVSFNYNTLTTANEWHHYAFCFDGKNVKVYKDGVEQTSLSQSFANNTVLSSFNSLFLGLSFAGGVYRKVNAKYSDFRIYATALSVDDIKELYNAGGFVDNQGNVYGYELKEE